MASLAGTGCRASRGSATMVNGELCCTAVITVGGSSISSFCGSSARADAETASARAWKANGMQRPARAGTKERYFMGLS
ncbi:hypothetical protein D3C78_1874230 [compost metagenome]